MEGDLALKRKKEIYDCQKLCDEDTSRIVVPLHCHTGGDFTSGFYARGKKTIINELEKCISCTALLDGVGEKLPVTSEIETNLEQFTIKVKITLKC